MPYSTRVHRLLRIMNLIAAEAGLTATKLAAKLGRHVRTVYRDIVELRAAGIPIEVHDDPVGYSLPRSFYLRPIELTFEEAIAVSLLTHACASSGEMVVEKVANTALEKIRAVLPLSMRENIQHLMAHTSVKLARTQSREPQDIYQIVRAAIQDRRAIKCTYESLNKRRGSELFRFDPYALHFSQRAWYVIGKHHGHKEIRTLKLSRFVTCKPTQTPYMIPDDFTISSYLGKAWRMIRSGKIYQIHLHFTPQFAETVADTLWHESQETVHNNDGSVDLHFEVDGLDEITWWILSYGPGCRVIEPPELRASVRKLLGQSLKQYAR